MIPMKAYVLTSWNEIRDSYWFTPGLMATSAVLASFVTTTIDGYIGSEWLEDIGWLYANKPDGARAVMSTIAGSMITVAGVTFSMTILSISYATGQVGPRLLSNFMRDRGNQFTLGVFISAFLYCLLVLRTIRDADDPPPPFTSLPSGAELSAAFVPHIAVIFGLLLAVMSVGVLIFFIHHIPESIHVANIVARVGKDLNRDIEVRFPECLGDPAKEEEERSITVRLPETFHTDAANIRAGGNGYIQYVSQSVLMETAKKHDLVLRMRFRAGDFVACNNTLMLAYPKERVDEKVTATLHGAFAWGNQRSPQQNLLFLFNQLIEVASRALSTGVNDPFTAMNCLDWLQTALSNIANRKLPDAYRYDENQKLRVIAQPLTFEDCADTVFDQLRPYVARDRNTAIHTMEVIAKTAVEVPSEAHRRHLVRHATALLRHASHTLHDKRDTQILRQRYRSLLRMLKDPAFRRELAEKGDWYDGTA